MKLIMKMPKPIDAPRKLSLRDSRPILLRAGTGLAIAAGFLWVTSQVDPTPSSAVSNTPRAQSAIAGPAAAEITSRHLGTLEGKNYWVRLTATSDGPRYSVIDHLGATIAQNLTESEMYVEFPELQLETMTAGPVMMVTDNN